MKIARLFQQFSDICVITCVVALCIGTIAREAKRKQTKKMLKIFVEFLSKSTSRKRSERELRHEQIFMIFHSIFYDGAHMNVP